MPSSIVLDYNEVLGWLISIAIFLLLSFPILYNLIFLSIGAGSKEIEKQSAEATHNYDISGSVVMSSAETNDTVTGDQTPVGLSRVEDISNGDTRSEGGVKRMDDQNHGDGNSHSVKSDKNILFSSHQIGKFKSQILTSDTEERRNEKSPSTKNNQELKCIIIDVAGTGADDKEGNDNNTYRCACETGFLPPGLLKSFGGVEAMLRVGTGQCYHKM